MLTGPGHAPLRQPRVAGRPPRLRSGACFGRYAHLWKLAIHFWNLNAYLPGISLSKRISGGQQARPGRFGHGADPAALQLRLLQTTVEVAAEKNSRVVIVPVPVEVLRFLDRAASGDWPGPAVSGGSPAQPVVQAEAGQHENANRQSPQSALSQQHQLPHGGRCSSHLTGVTIIRGCRYPPAAIVSTASTSPMLRSWVVGSGKGRCAWI